MEKVQYAITNNRFLTTAEEYGRQDDSIIAKSLQKVRPNQLH
jgi:hypothetical protein